MTSAVNRRADRTETVARAAQDVLDAGERIALDWLELLRVEWTERARSLAGGFALSGAGAALLVFAWILLSAALAVALERRIALEWSLGITAAAQAALGGILLGFARRRRSEP